MGKGAYLQVENREVNQIGEISDHEVQVQTQFGARLKRFSRVFGEILWFRWHRALLIRFEAHYSLQVLVSREIHQGPRLHQHDFLVHSLYILCGLVLQPQDQAWDHGFCNLSPHGPLTYIPCLWVPDHLPHQHQEKVGSEFIFWCHWPNYFRSLGQHADHGSFQKWLAYEIYYHCCRVPYLRKWNHPFKIFLKNERVY